MKSSTTPIQSCGVPLKRFPRHAVLTCPACAHLLFSACETKNPRSAVGSAASRCGGGRRPRLPRGATGGLLMEPPPGLGGAAKTSIIDVVTLRGKSGAGVAERSTLSVCSQYFKEHVPHKNNNKQKYKSCPANGFSLFFLFTWLPK